MDVSEAERSPGVVSFLFADDIPGSNITGMRQDETVFADSQVFFCRFDQSECSMEFRMMLCLFATQVTCVGHIIGAVVADTQVHAQRAAKAVKIQYEELQPVITIQVGLDTPGLQWTNQGSASLFRSFCNNIFCSFY